MTELLSCPLGSKLLMRTPCQNEGERRWLLSLLAMITCSTTTYCVTSGKNDPKPSETIWKPCGNMEKAYWCKYSKLSSYSTPWPLVDGWEDGSNSKVFTLDMLEERHLGASFGQQVIERQLL
ncbi:unnamed protein product [Prunus armeniaca]